MARSGQGKITAAAAGVVIASLLAVHAIAETAGPATPPTTSAPVPYSPECQGGTTPIVAETPLPNVTAALKSRKTIRILAIGSSAGRRHGGYTAQIERLLKQAMKGIDIVTINRGVSGELAAAAAHRIRNEVALNDPDLVIWQVGTNDALAFVPLEELADAVQTTVRWLKAHNVDVVLAGLQYVSRVSQDEHYYRVRELMRDIATKEHVMIIRRYEATQFISAVQQNDDGFGPDEFERTEAGYNCLAQYLASAITLGVFGKGMSSRPLRRDQQKQ
jgi:lysophospholipase L1-like esterase